MFENPPSRFFFFLPKLLSLPLQAAKIDKLSYVKKHLDVYDSKMILMFHSKMSVLIVCLDAYTILTTMKSLME